MSLVPSIQSSQQRSSTAALDASDIVETRLWIDEHNWL